eukprot:15281026-Ditylum_brightwellii.AAC.1
MPLLQHHWRPKAGSNKKETEGIHLPGALYQCRRNLRRKARTPPPNGLRGLAKGAKKTAAEDDGEEKSP